MRLVFRCGHEADIDVDKVTSPICWCGERIVARTRGVGAPRIVGHARGPLVEGRYLGPQAVPLAKTPLVLKDEGHAAE
jgi:hypothetical protein